MLKCQHVEQRADALVDGERLPLGERLALRMHLIICRHCRRYVRQLHALVRKLRGADSVLPDDEAEKIVKRTLDDQER